MGISSRGSETESLGSVGPRLPWVVGFHDAIAVTRPTLLIPLWTMHLLGALHGLASGGHLPFILMPPAKLLLLSMAHSAILAAAYILNQMTDAASDARNGKLMLVAERHISVRRLVALMSGCVLGALVLAWVAIVLWDVGIEVVGVLGGSIALGVAYSAPPVRLKARAGWDLLSNAVGFGILAFIVGWVSVAELQLVAWITALPYALCVSATFAFTTIPDIPGELEDGARTLGVALGPRRTAWLGVVALVGACAVGGWVKNGPALGAAFVALPMYTLSAIRIQRAGMDARLTRTTQLVILTLAMVAALGSPTYAVWLIVVIAYVRWYYARRFGMKYP